MPIYCESVHSRRYSFPTSFLSNLWRTQMMKRTLAFGLLLLCTSVRSSAQIDQVTKALGLGSQRQLTDSKVSAGLKEALRVGAETFRQTHRQNRRILCQPSNQDSLAQKPAPTGKRARPHGLPVKSRCLCLEHESSGRSRSSIGTQNLRRCHPGHDF